MIEHQLQIYKLNQSKIQIQTENRFKIQNKN